MWGVHYIMILYVGSPLHNDLLIQTIRKVWLSLHNDSLCGESEEGRNQQKQQNQQKPMKKQQKSRPSQQNQQNT